MTTKRMAGGGAVGESSRRDRCVRGSRRSGAAIELARKADGRARRPARWSSFRVGIAFSFRLSLGLATGSSVLFAAAQTNDGPGTWSPIVEDLQGRLVVASSRITPLESFQVDIEIRNQGKKLWWIEVGDPLRVTIEVLDAAGTVVPPTAYRTDLLHAIEWRKIPARSSTLFPVSQVSEDGAKGSHLDVISRTWKLPLGRYRIRGRFSMEEARETRVPGDETVEVWRSALDFPKIAVEIVPEGPGR